MTPPVAPLAVADQALLATLRGWSKDGDALIWNCFEPGWRQTLQDGWNQVVQLSPAEARDRVRLEQQAQALPDWNRVHPSWWLRALKAETEAVRRVVVAHAPEGIRESLQAGLGFTDDDLRFDVPPRSEALNAALALWSERLVGDWADRDDPPVVLALTRLDLNEVTRLIAAIGLTKWTLSGTPLPVDDIHSHGRTLQEQVRATFSAIDPQLKQQAELDVAGYRQVKRDTLGSIGLVTLARLLEVVEPYRLRWTLQHLPYQVAKLLRGLMARRDRRAPEVFGWESEILKFAWNALHDEGLARDVRGVTS